MSRPEIAESAGTNATAFAQGAANHRAARLGVGSKEYPRTWRRIQWAVSVPGNRPQERIR
jgi:hypothetical protein